MSWPRDCLGTLKKAMPTPSPTSPSLFATMTKP